MNTAYKHLDSKLRIAELTVWQWLGVLIGLGIGVVWGFYVSPFGSTVTLVTSIYAVALPAAAALFASRTDFDLWLLLRSAIAWRRRQGRLAPGGGSSARGYTVSREETEASSSGREPRLDELDLSALWGRS